MNPYGERQNESIRSLSKKPVINFDEAMDLAGGLGKKRKSFTQVIKCRSFSNFYNLCVLSRLRFEWLYFLRVNLFGTVA